MLFDRLFRVQASGVRTQRKHTSEQHVNETFNGKALKHANNVLLWLRISVVSRESNSTAELTLMWMYVVLCSLLIRRRQNCNRQNVRCSTILRYFSKSRSWRHFYSPRSKIVISHTKKVQKSMKDIAKSPSAISGSTLTLWSYENILYTKKTKITTLFNNLSPLRLLWVSVVPFWRVFAGRKLRTLFCQAHHTDTADTLQNGTMNCWITWLMTKCSFWGGVTL